MKVRILLMLLILITIIPPRVEAANEGIGWIPTWKQAVAEARQTNKPILLMSGAPECGGVPGVW